MSEEQLQFTDEALQGIIGRYTREAGVRQLERNIGSVARKVALKVAQGKGDVFTVKPEELEEYLGHEMFFHEMARQTLPPGVATGHGCDRNGRRGFVYRSDAACRDQRVSR